MEELAELRKAIDAIDDELLELLVKRFYLSIAVKEVKQFNKIEVLDGKREQEIVDKILSINEEQRVKEAILEVYQSLLKASKDIQKVEGV